MNTPFEQISGETEKKYQSLLTDLKLYPSLAVAFSAGVDSTFLLDCAHNVLGDRVTAFTARSCSFPERELLEAKKFCAEKKIRHIILNSEELNIPGFCDNPKNRCYLCKRELFEKIRSLSQQLKISHIAEGSNSDDNGDYRPGLKAIEELGILSPLRHAGLNKEEIRRLSFRQGLSTWNKQSFACLSSRFVYGEKITLTRLKMVERAEQLLLDLGFHQVRVRIHGMTARIEVNKDEIIKIFAPLIRDAISAEFHQIGFTFVTVDIDGYKTGSMNKTLPAD
ncbi:MAG: ATP-dependent sacrificial sulfur transferase LarE [Verrucomicrobia bacterium]|nr:ATP-dependent sacrificial sulfur transferase LarE [Verrucomicrobiota bacterium]MBO7391979.1 ATP-dependent sacrificial sulfur transferase LarE [Verrucomicrobiota bacterium]MBO7524932.1 ATP-dependent sacrificial sulfur transferase LarE [Verrucomicrobiota bacterium]MBP5761147.1 ATP-dependent sacrificial sulfur transferase LarE [Verrucomicrobiota bacterium]